MVSYSGSKVHIEIALPKDGLLAELLALRELFKTDDVTGYESWRYKRNDPNIISIGTKDDRFALVVKKGWVSFKKDEKDNPSYEQIMADSPEQVLKKFVAKIEKSYECVVSSSEPGNGCNKNFTYTIEKRGEKLVRTKLSVEYSRDNGSSDDY